MKNQTAMIVLIAAFIIMAAMATYKTILKSFLPQVEGFSATPYWDYKQWSWGYGTKVPGSANDPAQNPGGTITREQAIVAAIDHVRNDYLYLKPLISVSLSPNRWAALLSFSYNLGPANADNLVPNINKQDTVALQNQWMSYVHAGGVVLPSLIDRRAKEWSLWMKG
jgi:lysozyme